MEKNSFSLLLVLFICLHLSGCLATTILNSVDMASRLGPGLAKDIYYLRLRLEQEKNTPVNINSEPNCYFPLNDAEDWVEPETCKFHGGIVGRGPQNTQPLP
jgi:hypothetical protein